MVGDWRRDAESSGEGHQVVADGWSSVFLPVTRKQQPTTLSNPISTDTQINAHKLFQKRKSEKREFRTLTPLSGFVPTVWPVSPHSGRAHGIYPVKLRTKFIMHVWRPVVFEASSNENHGQIRLAWRVYSFLQCSAECSNALRRKTSSLFLNARRLLKGFGEHWNWANNEIESSVLPSCIETTMYFEGRNTPVKGLQGQGRCVARMPASLGVESLGLQPFCCLMLSLSLGGRDQPHYAKSICFDRT